MLLVVSETVGFSRHYIVYPMLLPSGNPFKCHEEVLYLQLMIPPNKRFDIFPLVVGCSRGLGAFIFFFRQLHSVCVCVCVCVFFPFILDIKFVGRSSRGHTGFFIHLPSAVRALSFLATRI